VAEGAGWPTPANWLGYLSLETREATVAYWAGVVLVVSGLFASRLLPCVDYPQHLALSDVARRLFDLAAPEHAEYQLNYFTYNGLFHLLVARLSAVLPLELAGRLVVASSLLLMAGAVVALLRVLGRPPVHAALFTPVLFSFSVGWGFVNYVLATAIAVWTLVFVAKVAIRPSLGVAFAVAVLGFSCAFAHVLAMLILCFIAAALALEVGWRAASGERRGWRRALGTLGRAVCACLPLLLGCAYCVAVNARQYAWDPNMYRDPTMEGSGPPIWEKVVFFGAFATDLYRDALDQVVLWASILVMVWSGYVAWRERRGGEREPERPPPIVAPLAAALAAYFATPEVVLGTHLVFPRLAQWAVLGGVLAMPRFPTRFATRARRWSLRLGVAAGISTLLHCAFFGVETADASALIDDLPPGRSVTAVIWEPRELAFRNGQLTHLAAYYGARKHGQWAFAFARYLSVPVRFKDHCQPAWPEAGWEFSPEDYDPRCKYARAFPLVIVKAPSEVPPDPSAEPLVRKIVFKQDAAEVRLLSHHGHYWAFDTTGLPDDGKF
jgi:hypothetical protein